MSFRETVGRFYDGLRGWLARLRDNIRHRWLYRPAPAASAEASGPNAESGFFTKLDRPGFRAFGSRVAVALIIFLLFYYPIGMALVHTIDDDPDFTPSGENAAAEGGSKTAAMMAALIEREVNVHSWTANDPFFQPGVLLDNMPNYQTGIISSLARVSLEMTDQLGRTRGSSEADSDLREALGKLQYPGDVWIWDPSVSLAIKASSESQYREARRALLRYNARLGKGEAVFERRADNLMALLERMASDLGSSSAVLDDQLRDHSGDFIDTRGDDIFYNTKGKLYGYYMILKALGEDFSGVIGERNARSNWDQMVATFRDGAILSPLIVVNGRPDSVMRPSHLASQGFYLLRGRTQLREVVNILLK